MRISQNLFISALLAAVLFVSCPSWAQVQPSSGAASTPPNPRAPERSIEDLNRVGAETAMPPFADSPINIDSGFRQKLVSEGVALRSQLTVTYAQNTLEAPVPADTQNYVGAYPFESIMYNWTLTADLRQMHLKHTELYVCGGWYWVSWNPAGPKAFQLHTLYLYKAFADRRVEVKAGYIGNNMELIGLSIGGSLATAAKGVYAVLPYEVGVSNFPLTAPSFNLRIQGPKHTYLRAVAQRSIDPHGGPKEVERNHTGFRFIPNGDKLLLFDEMGYRRTASATAHDTWFRAGYIHNSSPFYQRTFHTATAPRSEAGGQSSRRASTPVAGPDSEMQSAITLRPDFFTRGSRAAMRSGSSVIELIIGGCRQSVSARFRAPGSELSRHSGTSTASSTTFTSHSRLSASLVTKSILL